MRVALVHDRLTGFGGSERVARVLKRAWPQAPLHVAVADDEVVARFGFDDVVPAFLDRVPGGGSRALVPLQQLAFRRMRVEPCDVVISNSCFFASNVRVPRGAAHVVLCQTPARYLWGEAAHLQGRSGGPFARGVIRSLAPLQRRVDRAAMRRADRVLANSTWIASEVRRCYARESQVLAPPVDVAGHRVDRPTGEHLAAVASLFPYKRIDAAIEVCNDLRLPLKVVGGGEDLDRLRALAGPTVDILGWVEEAEKIDVVATARAFLAPQVEDFGIAMVEALAAGVPVVAPSAGGALDIVGEGCGKLFPPGDAAGLRAAVEAVLAGPVDRDHMRAAADRFDEATFVRLLREHVDDVLATRSS